MPLAIACAAERSVKARSPMRTSTATPSSRPAMRRANRVRPAPTSPPRPTISPAPSRRATGAAAARTASSIAGLSPMSKRRARKRSSTSWPTMCRTSSVRVISAVRPVNTSRPLRSTVTLSAISKTSSRRCETKRTSRPRRFSSLTMAKRRVRSSADRTAVGSSSVRMRADVERARAISTSCRPATLSEPAMARGSSGRPNSASRRAVRSCSARRSSRRQRVRGSRPSQTFSATLSSGRTASSW